MSTRDMKRKSIILIVMGAVIVATSAGCELINNGERLEDSKGLDLYWAHRIFHELGRGYIFEFYEVERSDLLHELEFEYHIDNYQKSIDIKLVEKINKGECPQFPKPGAGDESDCVSKGGFYIPEDLVNEGIYRFTVRSSGYSIQSEIHFTKEKTTLLIPHNNYVSSAIQDVFVAPKNLLHGSIVCEGEQNLARGLAFIEDLRSLGLKDSVLTDLTLIKVDDDGNPIIESWPPNYYSIPFLLTMTVDFPTIFQTAKFHYDNNAINIYLFNTNGDQARLDFQGVMYQKPNP